MKTKNDLLKYKRFIVVESESLQPMAFDGDQFCYCTSDYWDDKHWPVRVYTLKMAKKLMAKSRAYRKRRKFHVTNPTDYALMPVKI